MHNESQNSLMLCPHAPVNARNRKPPKITQDMTMNERNTGSDKVEGPNKTFFTCNFIEFVWAGPLPRATSPSDHRLFLGLLGVSKAPPSVKTIN